MEKNPKNNNLIFHGQNAVSIKQTAEDPTLAVI